MEDTTQLQARIAELESELRVARKAIELSLAKSQGSEAALDFWVRLTERLAAQEGSIPLNAWIQQAIEREEERQLLVNGAQARMATWRHTIAEVRHLLDQMLKASERQKSIRRAAQHQAQSKTRTPAKAQVQAQTQDRER